MRWTLINPGVIYVQCRKEILDVKIHSNDTDWHKIPNKKFRTPEVTKREKIAKLDGNEEKTRKEFDMSAMCFD